MSGKSLRLFVTGDSPRSLKKISEFNWSGHAFFGSREQIGQLAKREESQGTGIYFLLSDMNSDFVKMYIGETENFLQRIKNHHQSKDWWTHFIVFQSENSNLNKAHVRYLEYIFWNKAKVSTQIELMNTQEPVEPKLSEETISELDIFKENILYILEALNISYFTNSDITKNSLRESDNESQEYSCLVPNSDFEARMTIINESYILKAGSHLKSVARESFERKGGYYAKWDEIINSKQVEKINQEVCKLLVDLEFTSPSAAGAMVRAGATNGLTCWKNLKTNQTLKEELGE